jgi:hypothetical protein
MGGAPAGPRQGRSAGLAGVSWRLGCGKRGNIMTLLRSLFMLGFVVCTVLVPIFIGHALAVHETRPLFYAAGLLALAAVLGLVQVRETRRAARESSRAGH